MKNRKLLIGILVGVLVVLIIGFTYAYFSLLVEGEGNLVKVTSGKMEITYTDGDSVSLSDAYPGDSISKTFTVENTGTVNAKYKITFDVTTNTFVNDELIFTLKKDDEEVSNGVVKTSSFDILTEITIEPDAIHNYEIIITFKETGQLQNDNLGATFNGKITVSDTAPWYSLCTNDNSSLRCKMITSEMVFADNVSSNYVSSETGIDFGTISSDTNGKGLYYTSDLTKTEDVNNDGTGERVYYYRGAVENNYVVFADFCWRIVRTNEDGSVKLRYGGTPDGSGNCPQTGTDVNIGTSAFNETYDDAKYVGYMYDENTSSTAKSTIDTWYANNIATKGEKITNLIQDTIYCNDTTVSSTSSNATYGAYGRLYSSVTNKTPQYKCAQASDAYTVSTSNGNGKLTYPISLLTADEVAYAGGIYGAISTTTYYLHTARDYWTISPFISSPSVGVVNSYGNLNSVPTNDTTIGLVPAISLSTETTVSQGTGLYNDPYIIE